MQATAAKAIFVDGNSNRRRSVELRVGVDLEIIEHGEIIASWPWDTIRKADSGAGELRLNSTSGPKLARLYVADPEFANTIASFSPSLFRGVVRRTSTWKIVSWSVAAAISIILVGLFGVPYAADRLAPLLPQSVDNRIGEMVDSQVKAIFGRQLCENPAGKQAYNVLVNKLAKAGNVAIPLRAGVLNSPVKNAIALPGGRIYFFRGLLDVTKSVDEFAGVLAHEIGHAHHRDGLRKVLQAGGTSYLLGLLFGDVAGAGAVVFAARVLLDKAYTRTVEVRADGFAIEAFRRLGRSAAPMGELLVRITGKQSGKRSAILASHPFSEDRLARMKNAQPEITGPPLLNAAQWQALKSICDGLPRGKGKGKGKAGK